MEYTLRTLQAQDILIFTNIIRNIGFSEFKGVITPERIKNLLPKESEEDDEVVASKVDVSTAVGMSLLFEIAEIILNNLEKCQADVFKLLSNLSGMTVQEIAEIDIVTFAQMIVDVVKKEEFGDFFKVAQSLFK